MSFGEVDPQTPHWGVAIICTTPPPPFHNFYKKKKKKNLSLSLKEKEKIKGEKNQKKNQWVVPTMHTNSLEPTKEGHGD